MTTTKPRVRMKPTVWENYESVVPDMLKKGDLIIAMKLINEKEVEPDVMGTRPVKKRRKR